MNRGWGIRFKITIIINCVKDNNQKGNIYNGEGAWGKNIKIGSILVFLFSTIFL